MRLQAELSRSLQAELANMQRMGSASLREAVEALKTHQHNFSATESAAVMRAACERANSIQSDMRYWDIVAILQTYAVCMPKDQVSQTELATLANMLHGKISQLSVKHLVDVLHALEQCETRPAKLMNEIANRLVDITKGSMYADELVALTRVMARNRLQPGFVDAIVNGLLSNDELLAQLRFLHSCEVMGALAGLGRVDQRLATKLEEKCMYELQVMPLEELWRTVTGFTNLAYSYLPFEAIATERMREVSESMSSDQFDQVTRPMDFLQFLRFRDLLTDAALVSACKWANDAVYRPATRTQAFRRPTLFEVALLADLCLQRSIPTERIEKAITVTIASKGGTVQHVAKPKPLRYRRRRAYIREKDGYAVAGVRPICALPEEVLSEKKTSDAAFAPKLRAAANGVPLWKARSGPWFFRK